MASNRSKRMKTLIICSNNTRGTFFIDSFRQVKQIPPGVVIVPYFTRRLEGQSKQISANHFKVIKVIGKGGFSKVFMVRKKDSGVVYAMKVVKTGSPSENKLRQIVNERVIMEKLDHPFVTKLHYAFKSVKYYFFKIINLERKFTFYIGSMHRGWIILLIVIKWKISRVDGQILFCRDSYRLRILAL